MNLKKYIVAAVAIAVSTASFALTLPKPDDPLTQMMQQMAQQQEQLNKQFDEHLLAPVKNLANFALKYQQADELTETQQAQLTTILEQVEKGLNTILTPLLQELDLDQVNQQYAQLMQLMGQENAEPLTLESMTDLFKALFLMSALEHFNQTNALTPDQYEVLLILLAGVEE